MHDQVNTSRARTTGRIIITIPLLRGLGRWGRVIRYSVVWGVVGCGMLCECDVVIYGCGMWCRSEMALYLSVGKWQHRR
jgi:hypothetical protein